MTSGCPKDFPFSYYQGSYCCLTGYEKAGAGDDQSAWLDSCNGSKLSERGITLTHSVFIACPIKCPIRI